MLSDLKTHDLFSFATVRSTESLSLRYVEPHSCQAKFYCGGCCCFAARTSLSRKKTSLGVRKRRRVAVVLPIRQTIHKLHHWLGGRQNRTTNIKIPFYTSKSASSYCTAIFRKWLYLQLGVNVIRSQSSIGEPNNPQSIT